MLFRSRKGEPGRAIWLGVWASFVGGLLGGVFLIGATEPLARIALQFGPWEFFSLFVLALSMVAGLTEASLLKGLIAGCLGLIVTVLGADPVMGQERLAFGIDFIKGGIDFLPVLLYSAESFTLPLSGVLTSKIIWPPFRVRSSSVKSTINEPI